MQATVEDWHSDKAFFTAVTATNHRIAIWKMTVPEICKRPFHPFRPRYASTILRYQGFCVTSLNKQFGFSSPGSEKTAGSIMCCASWVGPSLGARARHHLPRCKRHSWGGMHGSLESQERSRCPVRRGPHARAFQTCACRTVQEGAKHVNRHMTNDGRVDDGGRKQAFKSYGFDELTSMFGCSEGAQNVEAMSFVNVGNDIATRASTPNT